MSRTEASTPADKPWLNATLPLEERIELLLGAMSLEDKVGQLIQYPFKAPAKAEPADLNAIRGGRIGSLILAGSAWAGHGQSNPLDPEALNAVQRMAVEESPLGIPLIYGRDVIHGHATVLPIPLAQAASFDTALIEEASSCVAREARAQGVHWAFAPMVDLCRDPRWGRIIEGYGEDPLLGSECGSAVVRGYQGDSPAAGDRMIACAKHFCGYGGAEGGRDYDTTEWTDDSLRNYVLPAFAATVKAGVGSLMSGFNAIGGTPVSSSKTWLREWLKEQQGFDGCVVSDWGAVGDLIYHGVAADGAEAAALGLEAGVDMEMIREHFEDELPGLLESGRIQSSQVDDAVRRVLRMKFRAGIFEKPYVEAGLYASVRRREDHINTARKVTSKSIVLLSNKDKLLPLAPKQKLKVAVLGPYASAQGQHLGAWCLDGNPADVTSILDGLKAAAPDWEILTSDPAFTDEMLFNASLADIVIACVGESPCRTGEVHSIAELTLPPGQEELIESLGRLGKPLVVVQCSGRPLPSPAADHYASAWLLAWHGGTEAGTAIADIITGQTAPSGRMPMSMPRTTGQIPCYYNRRRPGKIRQMPNYRYHQDVQDTPLFPFGYGLGYTEFTYSDTTVKILADAASGAPSVELSATITNTGPSAGETVAQCYVRDEHAQVARPERELKGFKRVSLAPGEKQTVSFALGRDALGYFGQDGTYRVDPGAFAAAIGADSAVPLVGFNL
ncbi:MAG: glycoside hydrolase family 3 N-terminal domain-containing protein [Puniceicoccales bacterium]